MNTVDELVVISGKGGTGKTSLVASFAVLGGQQVLADCDVDAADLHLVLAPHVQQRRTFTAGHLAVIDQEACTGCGVCAELCRFDAITVKPGPRPDLPTYVVDPVACEGCRVCVEYCPADAIAFPERTCGEWFVSNTRAGTMVHARLGIGAENSGKLVSLVRREARRLAEEEGAPRVLVDGPPGVGCPVIASVTGASRVLIVTEPTPTGEHDLDRVLTLAAHFGIPAGVLVNKWDLNEDMTARVEAQAAARGAIVIGRVRYDPIITAAQLAGRTVVEMGPSDAREDIERAWTRLTRAMPASSPGIPVRIG